MEKTSLKKIAAWSGGQLKTSGNQRVDNAVIDSRKASKNSLFFCFRGEKTDGHNYCGEVRRKGAYSIGEKSCCDILVKSTSKAIGRIAKEYIEDMPCKVIAVTGSAGKTTTVRIIDKILGMVKETVSTPGNFNNQIGLPLTLLKVKKTTEYAVTEMGANHKGEIAYLAGIAGPETGVVTNIGDAHLGYFRNREEILKAKLELAEYLNDSGGKIIYNYDDPVLKKECSRYENSISFGACTGADYTAVVTGRDRTGTDFKVNETEYRLNIPGSFNLLNGLAAFAAARSENIPTEVIGKGFKEIALPKQRMEKISAGKFEIIDDSYNANPEAVKSLYREIAELYSNKNIIAVIGTMLELGEFAEKLHYATGKYIGGIDNISAILTGGDFSGSLASGALAAGLPAKKVFKFSSAADAANIIKSVYGHDSLIVLKASRLQRFEKIIEQLKKEQP